MMKKKIIAFTLAASLSNGQKAGANETVSLYTLVQ